MPASMVPFVDVSRHQGTIRFDVMAARGVAGVIIRCGNGAKLDDRAHTYARDARAAGLTVGAYWFCSPKAHASGAAQMAMLLDRAGELDLLDLPPMMDVEAYVTEGNGSRYPVLTGDALHAWLCDGASYLEEADDRLPLLYSNAAYFNSQRMVAGELARLPLVCPRYVWYSAAHPPVPGSAALWETFVFGRTTKRPQIPTGWDEWDAWQWSAGWNRAGALYGCQSTDLDLNLARADAWAAWTARRGEQPAEPKRPAEPPVVVAPSLPPTGPDTSAPINPLTQGDDDMSQLKPYRWRDRRYTNEFLVEGTSVKHLCYEETQRPEIASLELVETVHQQTLDSHLAKSGLTHAALAPVPAA